MNEFTRILESMVGGDSKAAEKMMPLVYEELRRMAAKKMASERSGHTLQATALVHEAWIKLSGPQAAAIQWNGRRHFFAMASEAMRRVLIDHARRKRTSRRGGGWARVTLSGQADARAISRAEWIDLNDALQKLEKSHPERAELAKLRIVGGMTIDESAALLGVSRATIKRHWSYVRAWLSRELKRGDTPPNEPE